MKVYIASSFSLVPKVIAVSNALEEAGHEIMVKWWTRLDLKQKFAPLSPEEFYSNPECEFAYNRDKQGVWDAEALVFVADDTPRAYNEANIELGMADAWGIPCYSIGRLQNSVLYYGVKKCKDIQDLLTIFNEK